MGPVIIVTIDTTLDKWRTTFISPLNAAITGLWAVFLLCGSRLVRPDQARSYLSISFSVFPGELVKRMTYMQFRVY